ncbi:MAG: choice-of-anchor Q domain-containing protein [Thermoleophilia bacterium]
MVFRPAPGARVRTGELSIKGARDVEFRGFEADDLFIVPLNGPDGGPRPENVAFRNMTTRFFFVRSGKRVSIVGGSVGGIDEAISSTIGTYPGLPVSEDVLIDGVTFHDVTRDANPTGHIECLFVQESDRVVIRRSRFTRCDVMDVYVNDILGGTITNLTIENNAFDQPGDGGSYAVYVYPRGTGGNVRYNSFGASIIFDGAFEGWSAVGNVGRVTVCAEGIAFASNVWENQRCGPTDRRVRRVFRDPASFDLRPRPGSAAIDGGSASSYPATDIDGTPRPRGGRADAGAFEVR